MVCAAAAAAAADAVAAAAAAADQSCRTMTTAVVDTFNTKGYNLKQREACMGAQHSSHTNTNKHTHTHTHTHTHRVRNPATRHRCNASASS